jgi:predicted phosphoribosyltransferase
MFIDKSDAGKQLGEALLKYKDIGPLVLAIPCGGVEVGLEVAEKLDADFDIIITRKLPYPDNPEAGFGAIAEDGSKFMFPLVSAVLSEKIINSIIASQQTEIERRKKLFRGGRQLPVIEGRSIILVDDGIAMGSTMRASIMILRNRKAGKIIVAAPVAGYDTAAGIAKIVDDIVILKKPVPFYAVAQVYENWYDVGDSEVIDILKGTGRDDFSVKGGINGS